MRVEAPLDRPLFHAPTGFYYSVVDVGGALYQEESLIGPDGRRLHELRRRMDYVMGSNSVARTYFTEENGRLFQLPLTWYRQKGWDFSPGYELTNARFGRLLPDRCLACHGSYPQPFPFLEGKYAELPPGIGCERCHGPGALHVAERSSGSPADSVYDNTIVNPSDLPFERRMDVCDQCHVHTPVTVLREGRDAFDYLPSQPLRDHVAFFKATGSIDIVSHADRLRQSACFVASRPTERPLECATCHHPHQPVPDRVTHNQPCLTCHASSVLEERLASSASLADHEATADCVTCHMPTVKERAVPHGTFTDHWIRVVEARAARDRPQRGDDRPVEPYYERDESGPESELYQAMGEVLYGSLATDAQVLRSGTDALDRALGDDTTRGDAHFMLGLAYQQLGETAGAIRALERSLEIDPDRPQRLQALAQAYQRAGRDAATIPPLYERALELQPALAWIRAEYAHFLQAEGRQAEAEDAYRTALNERPGLAGAWFNLGTLLAETRRLDEASDAFQQAVRLDPALGEALSSLIEIRTVGRSVIGVRPLGSPLPTLPVRGRRPNAIQVIVGARTAERGILFANVPAGASLRVLEPGGTVLRVMRADGSTVPWDLLTEAGKPVASGLYHVQVLEPGTSGSPVALEPLSFGIVRVGR